MPRRYDLPNHAHELTFSTYRSVHLLSRNDIAPIMLEAVTRACERFDVTMLAFVIMPNHVHLLVRPMGDDPAPMKDYLAAIKRPASHRIHRILETTLLEIEAKLSKSRTGFRLWQHGGGYDRNLTSPKAIVASIDYIHDNPVRKNLCAHPSEWPWSSWKQWHQPEAQVRGFMPKITREAVR